MTARRSGQRLRIEAHKRRNEVLRLVGAELLKATLVWFAVSATVAGLLYISLGRDGAVFAIGFGTGAYLVPLLVVALGMILLINRDCRIWARAGWALYWR